ncbi:MAG: hypothetical protein EPN48_04085 [Microbacteriaceae bacterium]|nr:MAG: hypothetical protein EPN48_04085 [Microbacteriaceae bacterium]
MRGAGLAVTVDRFRPDAALTDPVLTDSALTGPALTDPALTATQQLAVYRITQESLTNALKHSGAQPAARVTLDWRGPGFVLTVASSGAPRSRLEASVPGPGHGRGLYGMRERARLAGGWLTAGVDEDVPGGWLVTAFVPTGAAEPRTTDAAPGSTTLASTTPASTAPASTTPAETTASDA